MTNCSICGLPPDLCVCKEKQADEKRVTMKTRVSVARSELRGVVKVLGQLSRQNVGLADVSLALGKVVDVLSVTLEELEDVEKEQAAIGNDLGDHLLAHEGWRPSVQEWKEYLKDREEERKKEGDIA